MRGTLLCRREGLMPFPGIAQGLQLPADLLNGDDTIEQRGAIGVQVHARRAGMLRDICPDPLLDHPLLTLREDSDVHGGADLLLAEAILTLHGLHILLYASCQRFIRADGDRVIGCLQHIFCTHICSFPPYMIGEMILRNARRNRHGTLTLRHSSSVTCCERAKHSSRSFRMSRRQGV